MLSPARPFGFATGRDSSFGPTARRLPQIIPRTDRDVIRMRCAARHLQRYSASDTKRGRPGRWKREEMLEVSARLNDILKRETSVGGGHVF